MVSGLIKPVLGSMPRIGAFPMPVGLWLFNEGSGRKVYDLSGNGLDGAFVADTHWSSGKFGSAVDLDGDGDYVLVPPSPLLEPDYITVACRVLRRAAAIGESQIASMDGPTNRNWQLRFALSTGNPRFLIFYDNGSNVNAGSSMTMDDNRWYFVVGTYDGLVVRLYVDGVEVGSTIQAGVLDKDGPELHFGRLTTSHQFDGLIDYVMIWDHALTAPQVSELHQDPFPWFKRNPIELWAAATIGAAPPGTTPKGPLHHPLFGPLAGPLFC